MMFDASKGSRRIFSNSGTSPSELAELIQWVVMADLLVRSDRVWLVAPSIDNAPMLDNRTGIFDELDPGWGRRQVRLIDVALRMASEGVQVVITAPPSEPHAAFFDELRAAARDHGLEQHLIAGTRPWINCSGILTRHGLIRGALDFGREEVRQLDDVVTFETAPDDLKRLREQFDANAPHEDGRS